MDNVWRQTLRQARVGCGRAIIEQLVIEHLLPGKFFHLYLGELSFRFNHQDEDLFPL